MINPDALTWGRLIEHDPRSRAYATSRTTTPADVLWPRYGPILDQGDLGACTGFAMAGWLQCAPHCAEPTTARTFNAEYARKLYSIATTLDPFPGTYPPTDTGSSGNAVAKAARQLGEIRSYSWAFTTAGLLSALQHSPVIAGVQWHEAMMRPTRNGVVRVAGNILGGHEILIRGLRAGHLVCDNSWSAGWGTKGSFLLPVAQWEILRRTQADVTIPQI